MNFQSCHVTEPGCKAPANLCRQLREGSRGATTTCFACDNFVCTNRRCSRRMRWLNQGKHRVCEYCRIDNTKGETVTKKKTPAKKAPTKKAAKKKAPAKKKKALPRKLTDKEIRAKLAKKKPTKKAAKKKAAAKKAPAKTGRKRVHGKEKTKLLEMSKKLFDGATKAVREINADRKERGSKKRLTLAGWIRTQMRVGIVKHRRDYFDG